MLYKKKEGGGVLWESPERLFSEKTSGTQRSDSLSLSPTQVSHRPLPPGLAMDGDVTSMASTQALTPGHGLSSFLDSVRFYHVRKFIQRKHIPLSSPLISNSVQKKHKTTLKLNFRLLPPPTSIPVGFHLFQCVLWNWSPAFPANPTTWGLLF